MAGLAEVDTTSSTPVLYTPGRLVGYGQGSQSKYAEFGEGIVTNIFFDEIQPQTKTTLSTSLLDPYLIEIVDPELWNGLFDSEEWFLEGISFFTWVDMADFDSEADDQPPALPVPVLGLTEILTSDCEISFPSHDEDTDEPMRVFNLGDGEVAMIDFQDAGTGPYPAGIFHGFKIVTLTNRVDYYEITNESQTLIETFRFGELMDPPLQNEADPDLEHGQFTALRGIKGVFTNVDPDATYKNPHGAEDSGDEDYEDPEGAIDPPDPIIVRTVIALGITEREE